MLFQFNVAILLIFRMQLVASWDDQRTIEVVSILLEDKKCTGIVVALNTGCVGGCLRMIQDENKELAEKFIDEQKKPLTLLESVNGTVTGWNKDKKWDDDPVCWSVVIFSHEPGMFKSLYRQIMNRYNVNKIAIVSRFPSETANQLLSEIQNENFFVVLEKPGRDLELCTWAASYKTFKMIIKINSSVSADMIKVNSMNLLGRHLKIGTVSFPPSDIIDDCGQVTGIEPSLLETIAGRLKFSYEYVQASPNEMWGEINRNGDNVTITGLLGMLSRKEVDVVLAQLYISLTRWRVIGYTVVYKFSYESFLVPAPRPYAKWTALFYSFTLPTWIATIVSSIAVIIMLRLVAALTMTKTSENRDIEFVSFQFCFLYVVGNLSGTSVQPQSILSTANRIFLIWWLFGTLILTTGYRSGLISYMTFPFTPPAIDTLQQLLASPLKKASYGSYSKGILANASSAIERNIGEELIPHNNLTEMFVLIESGMWAVHSNLDNIPYMANIMYPTTAAGPQVHLIKDTILPVWAAFGLQQNSQLKPYFDKEIQRLIESGLVDYHTTAFAKKLDSWNPKKANDRVSFSLDSLQGAFYLLGIGFVVSVIVFITEATLVNLHFRTSRQFK